MAPRRHQNQNNVTPINEAADADQNPSPEDAQPTQAPGVSIPFAAQALGELVMVNKAHAEQLKQYQQAVGELQLQLYALQAENGQLRAALQSKSK